MSACIIHTDIFFGCIRQDMGRLRFTLTNIMIWIVIILSCFLSENFAIFNNDPIKGFSLSPAYFLSFTIILFLVFYYFLEHKKNGLKFDVVLLPSFIAFAIIMIANIFRQDVRTFTNFDQTGTMTVTFSMNDKLLAALQVVVWLSLLYALLFVYNRFRLNKESYRWIPKIYLVVIILLCVIDAFYEFDVIVKVFRGSFSGTGVQFFLGNDNVWGLLIFTGILSAILLSYKRFSWYYFSTMLALFTFLIFTTSATAIYCSFFAILGYIVYEVLSQFRNNRKLAIKNLIIFVSIAGTMALALIILILTKVPMFQNFWSFFKNGIINKNYFTLSGRRTIWKRVFALVTAHPLDAIFGLGHGTGSIILKEYVSHSLKSAHNGLLEILLRYGFLGLAIYVGFLGLTIFAFVKHFLRKEYRFVSIYGITFIAIMVHSMSESTTLFTPNVGGIYFGFVFVLPIVNIIQEKRLNSLKEDILSYDAHAVGIGKRGYLTLLFTFLFGIITVKFVNLVYTIDTFSNMLLALTVFLTTLFVVFVVNYKPLYEFNNELLNHYQKLIRKDLNENRV